MKRTKINFKYILIPVIVIGFISCQSNKVKVRRVCSEQNDRIPDTSPMDKTDSEIFAQDTIDNPNIHFTLITLPSLQCSTCQDTVESVLKRDKGVVRLLLDLYKKVVYVNYNSIKTNIALMENSIINSGYDANDKLANTEAYERLDECCKVPDEFKK